MPKTTQTPGSVLLSLMDEYQLNPYTLSREISLSHSAIRQIISGKSKLSVPAALRLAKFFDKTPAYWLDLQRDTDLGEAEKDKELIAVLKGISRVKKPAAKPKAQGKPAKKDALSEKRKDAAKVPGAKPARGRRPGAGKKK